MTEEQNLQNDPSSESPSISKTPRKKTMSAASIAANRANARKSTGPRTSNGKIKSSVNALRHGLYSEKYMVDTEDENTFRNFAASFVEEFQPRTASELELVDALIHTAWRRRRIASLISAHINQALHEVIREDDRMARMTMQNQTQTPEGAPAPQPPKQSPENLTIRAYARAERSDPSLPRLESHETRLVGLYLRLLTRLEKVQKERNEAILRQNPLLFAA